MKIFLYNSMYLRIFLPITIYRRSFPVILDSKLPHLLNSNGGLTCEVTGSVVLEKIMVLTIGAVYHWNILCTGLL